MQPPSGSSTLTLSAISFLQANRINLQWTAVMDATQYEIKRRVLGTAEWTSLVTKKEETSFYQDATAVGGTTYEYQVVATTTNETTITSNIVKQTAMGSVSTPTVSVNKKDITVNWSTVAGASRFKLFWGTSSQTYIENFEIIDSNARQYTIPGTDLLDRTKYYLVLKAYNDDGQVKSEEFRATTKFLEVLDSSFGDGGIWTLAGIGNHLDQRINDIDFDEAGDIYYAGALVNDDNGLDGLYGHNHLNPNDTNADFYTLTKELGDDSFSTLETLNSLGESLVGGSFSQDILLLKYDNSGEAKLGFWDTSLSTESNPGVVTLGTTENGDGPSASTTSEASATFTDLGRISRVARIVVDQVNQRIYVCETKDDKPLNQNFVASTNVYRFQFNGALDSSWGTNGTASLSISSPNVDVSLIVVDCILDNSNKLVVLGKAQFVDGPVYTTTQKVLVARFALDGKTLDTDFNSHQGYTTWDMGSLDEWPRRLIKLPSNKLLVLGFIYSPTTPSKQNPFLLNFTDAGVLNSSFGTGGARFPVGNANASFMGGVLDPLDTNIIYLTGWYDNANNLRDMAIWKFDLSQQQLDSSFASSGMWTHHNAAGGNGNDEGWTIKINPANHFIYVGGKSARSNGTSESSAAVIWAFK